MSEKSKECKAKSDSVVNVKQTDNLGKSMQQVKTAPQCLTTKTFSSEGDNGGKKWGKINVTTNIRQIQTMGGGV